MIVYKTTNLINGKTYIGQTTKDVVDYLGSGVILSKAIKKYGRENFEKEEIASCYTKKDLDFLEKFFIRYFNCKVPNGYNLTDGGEGLVNPSTEVRERIGISSRQRFKGKSYVELYGSYKANEMNSKKSLALKGKPLSEDLKAKLKKPKSITQNMGRYLRTKESKQKNREWHLGKPAWNRGLTKETDERVRKYGEQISIVKKGKKKSEANYSE
jgi:hypothetical protein